MQQSPCIGQGEHYFAFEPNRGKIYVSHRNKAVTNGITVKSIVSQAELTNPINALNREEAAVI